MRNSSALFSTLCVCAIASLLTSAGGLQAKTDVNATFTGLTKQYLGEAVVRDPLFADSIGIHTQDDRLPDLSAAGQAQRRRWQAAWRERFASIEGAALTLDNRVDLAQVLDLIDAELFEDD